MDYYFVKNWERFQHYKDRSPPWIKLHFEILASADWVMLADASKLLMVVCMMIASRNEGKVPNNPHYLQRVAYLNKLPDLTPLIKCGFLINMLADASDCKQEQADARPEKIRDREDKKERKKEYTSDFEILWKGYPRKDGSKSTAFESYEKSLTTGVTHETLIGSIEAFAAFHRAKGTAIEHIPHAATWLNQKRWEAEYNVIQPVIPLQGKPREIRAGAMTL